MMLYVIVLLAALPGFSQQASSGGGCECELSSAAGAFPHRQLANVNASAWKCSGAVAPRKALELQILLLGLERRLPQLESDVLVLEQEDDGELYGALSLQVIENELFEIQQLLKRLNGSTGSNQQLADDTGKQLEDLRAELNQLETYDTSQMVRRQQDNQRLKRSLDQCENGHHATAPPPTAASFCPHGHLLNISEARVNTGGEYPGSFKYGGWGRDPKPEAGKESWYWLVMMTSSNRHANYVRRYSSLSSLIVGMSVPGNVQIHPSNPTTNTIQGPNVVVYAEALYYNCYNKREVCQFDLTTKTVSVLKLSDGTRYNSKGNFGHPDEQYPYTDLDLATDESGVWVIYATTENFGNLVLSKLETGDPLALGQTWNTSVYKHAVTNSFMACGVLYATRYVNRETEEIFYSFDTSTGVESFHVGIFIQKPYANIYYLNYSPVDQMLYAYSEAYMISYKVLFD